MKIAANVDVEW